MNFLPIVERELRVAARRPATYRLRVFWALMPIGMAVIMGFIFSLANTSPGEMGRTLFMGMSAVAWLACLVAGFVTADCISGEKREGTLGLLFLTDLKAYDIVAGKLGANGINMVVGIMSMLPVMMIPILLGGVSLAEAARVTLTLGSTLLLSLSFGILTSALFRSVQAVTLVAVVGFELLVLVPAAGLWLGYKLGLGEPMWCLVIPSPAYAMVMSFDMARLSLARFGDFYWLSIGWTHLLAWLCLLLACRILPRKWQNSDADFPSGSGHGLWAWLTCGFPEQRARHRETAVVINPIYWLATRRTAGGHLSWFVNAGLFAAFLFWGGRSGFYWEDVWHGMLILFYLKVGSKTGFALAIGTPVIMGRKEGTLEFLLTTPLATQEFVQGLFRAARLQNAGWLGCVLLADIILWVAGRTQSGATGLWDLLWFSLVVLMFADLAPLRWAALVMVAKAKKPEQPPFLTFLLLNGPPALLVGLIFVLKWLLTPAPLAGAFSWVGEWMDERLLVLLWLAVSLVWDWLVLVWARRWVLQNFRAALLEPPETRPPGFSFLNLWARKSTSG